jgi:ATP-dependent Clp protease ATP-binding subunit ClpC
MPKYGFRLVAVTLTMENDTHLSEALFFPEISRYDSNMDRLHEAITANAARIIEDLQPIDLHKRRISGTPEIGEVKIQIEPPQRNLNWREPVSLIFHIVHWSHGEEAQIAFIPALDIEVISKEPEELESLIVEHIRAELLRKKISSSLGQLFWLERCRAVELDEFSVTANIRTPKQIAANLESEDKKKSVLKEVGIDLTEERLPRAYESEDTVSRIAEVIAGRNPRCVLLVGKSGVGKTASVYELVRRREEFQLGRAPFWATSGSKLIAGMSGFGMWQERCRQLWQEASKQKAILFIGNLVELMEVGKSASSSQGIAGFLRPYLNRGDMIAIAECTPEQLPLIEKEDPHLLDAFYQIKIEEPGLEKGRSILLNYVIDFSGKQEAAIDVDGIEALDRLHRRYATYSAYPGRPLRFLKNILQDRSDEKILNSSDVIAAFSRETGLPLFLLDDLIRLDLDEAKRWFSSRVIGQIEAIDLIVDLLATVKAGLTRPHKPIASLLFIGPTGVGKTEMAKALAEFLFQDRNRMLRFDMSEYADPISVKRLIGGVFGSEGLLTAKVREQPFSVVLLDEFEKAHPIFFDLLLQVLGEGRLTDAAGRLADFRNSVVIMTSNIGAESFQKGSIGYSKDILSGSEAARHFTNAVRAFIRPELFNRIDRIVPFTPLDEETILLVAMRELEKLKKRDGIRYRGISLELSNEVAKYVAMKGYDPKYGARPLKRAIERELLVPLAEDLNRYSDDLALTADIWIEDRLSVEVQPRLDKTGKQISSSVTESALAEIVSRCAQLRRNFQKLEWSPKVREIQNEIFRLERLAKKSASKTWKQQEEKERQERLPKLRQVIQSIKDMSEKIFSMEENALLALYGKLKIDRDRLAGDLERSSKEWQDLLLAVYALEFKNPDYITLAVYSEHADRLFDLSRAYYSTLSHSAAEVEIYQITAGRIDPEKERPKGRIIELEKGNFLLLQKVIRPEEFLSIVRDGVIGIVVGVVSSLVYPRYEPERGLHIFIEEEKQYKCLVHTSEASTEKYLPPPGISRRGAIGAQEKRRTYNFNDNIVEDESYKKRLYLNGRKINEAMATAINERLIEAAKSSIIGNGG